MGFRVYDFRTDIMNVLVTPQIRSRFLKMNVGQVNSSHSHDLGHEIFLILQGQAEFEMGEHKEVLGPGQLCIALVDEPHIVRNVGDDEVIMYLSVTPHILPTHTSWIEDGEKAPPRFSPEKAYDVEPDQAIPTADLVDRHLAQVEAFSEAVSDVAATQREHAALFKKAVYDGDKETALEARDEMWSALYPMFGQVFELADAWNDLGYRTANDEF